MHGASALNTPEEIAESIRQNTRAMCSGKRPLGAFRKRNRALWGRSLALGLNDAVTRILAPWNTPAPTRPVFR